MRIVFYALGLLAITAGQASAQWNVDAPSGATVTIKNESGSVTVVGSARNDVSVPRGSRDLERELTFEKNGREIQVTVSTQDVTVRVPQDAKLVIECGSGSVSVTGVRGPVDVETQSGSIEVRGVVESLHAESLSGSITTDGAVRRTYAETTSGSVRVMRARGSVDARSTSGSVQVRGTEIVDGKISSVSGSASFTGTITRNARLELESSSGQIEIVLPNNFSGMYDLTSISGDVENEFGPSPSHSRNGSGATLKFSTGSGARIVATTVSGHINLRAL
jgi:DUF4097 and DUF4098 domain-containing protein YvlB